MMSAKIATLALLEIKIFWNKGYDIIISAHDAINKILSSDSVDAVIWPTFGNSSTSLIKAIITSKKPQKEKQHSLRGVFVQV